MSERETASGELGLVQAFVNAVEMAPLKERLTGANTLQAWLFANGLLDGRSRPLDESDLKHAVAVREAMRGVIGGNSGYPVYPVDLATLNEAATTSRLRMRFAPDGRPRLEPEASGAVGAMGRLVATPYSPMPAQYLTPINLCTSPQPRAASLLPSTTNTT